MNAHQNTTSPQIVVLGAANSDFLLKGEKFPRPGETLTGDTFLAAAGGKGANQAVAVARLGVKAALISCVGADARGRELISGLDAEGIDTRFVSTDANEQTGAALIMIDHSGEKQILAAPGANAAITVAQVDKARAAISSAKVFLTQFEAPLETVLAGMRIARGAGVKVVLDPAPALARVPDELFSLVDAVRPNSHEAEMLSGMKVSERSSAARSARALQQRGIRIVAVQAGDEGNLLVWQDQEIWLPKIKVSAVDATGAGDAFAAALAVAIAEGQSPEDAGHFCNAAAALTTTKLGAQPALPKRSEVEALVKKVRGEK
jgi:ribokinase